MLKTDLSFTRILILKELELTKPYTELNDLIFFLLLLLFSANLNFMLKKFLMSMKKMVEHDIHFPSSYRNDIIDLSS